MGLAVTRIKEHIKQHLPSSGSIKKLARRPLGCIRLNGLNDALLVLATNVRVHGKRHNPLALFHRHRQAAGNDRIACVGLLHVQRDRVINRGRNAVRRQVRPEGVAIIYFDCVLCPGASCAGCKLRRFYRVFQAIFIDVGRPLAQDEFLSEYVEFHQKDGGLNRVET